MRLIIATLSVLLLTLCSAHAAGNLVIIAASNAGKLAPGSVLQPEKPLAIPAGGKVTLLSKNGDVIKLRGPYSGPAGGALSATTIKQSGDWSSTLTKIASLVSKHKKQSTVMGASRMTASADPEQPDFWLMAVDSSGHRCVRSQKVDMWRRKARINAKLSLRSKTARQTGLIWKAGERRMRLPQKFIEDGTLIVMNFDKEPRRFTMHITPENLATNRAGTVLQWMITNDCHRQAQIIIKHLHSDLID